MVASTVHYVWTQVHEAIVATRTELALFILAFALHHILFGSAIPGRMKRAGRKLPKPSPDEEGTKSSSPSGSEEETLASATHADAMDAAQALRCCEAAYERGDHRSVLRYWKSARNSSQVPPSDLVAVVESMQRFKKDSAMILTEVRGYLRRNPSLCDAAYVTRLLEPLAKSWDTEVVSGLLGSLPALGVKVDENLYEIMIQMHFASRSFGEVIEIGRTVRNKGLTLTPRMSVTLLKAALQQGDFDEAQQHFTKVCKEADAAVPKHLATQLVELACREHRAEAVVQQLEEGHMPLTTEMMNGLLAECARSKDIILQRRVEKLSRDPNLELNSRTYLHLLKTSGGEPSRMLKLLDEMHKAGIECSPEVANAVLPTCTSSGGAALADKLLDFAKAQSVLQVPVLLSLIRFYADAGKPQKSCEIFLQNLAASGDERVRTLMDNRTERCLLAAALQCKHEDLIEELVKDAPKDTAKYINLIRHCATRGKLDEAWCMFNVLEKTGADMTRSLFNALLDASVECGNFSSVEKLMRRMEAAGNTDVVSYNTLLKGYLRKDNFTRAWSVLDDMRRAGHQPNHVTFNELIHALVHAHSDRQREKVWKVVDEMKKCGVQPNRITCSILLKNLKAKSPQSDVQRTMDVLDNMSEPMDEVLLSSTVEACVRIGTPALIAQRLEKFQGKDSIPVNGAHTFGSLIKAYGVSKDIDGAWKCWMKMRSQHIRPTSITVGCMVEAVAMNGDVDGAYELIMQLLDDADCKDQVNAVVFGSVLKGYSRARRVERVFTVLQDMLSRGIEPSVITYNAVLDACARNARMDAVPNLLEEMKTRKLSPNLITYSTIIKGFCQKGDMLAALGALEDLQRRKDLRPDEIVYNTLLEGCAQGGLDLEAERLWKLLLEEGIAPSSYTLVVMVKVMGQARTPRALDRAFEYVEVEALKHRVKVTAQVYNTLLQACLTSRRRDLSRASSTFNRMVSMHMNPDARLSQTLVKHLLSSDAAGNAQQVAAILRHIASGPTNSTHQPSGRHTNAANVAERTNVEDSFFEEAIRQLAESPNSHGPGVAPSLLSDIMAARPKMRIDAALQRRVLAGGLHEACT